MTTETFAKIKSQKNGPIKKFQLIKAFGRAIRESGCDPKTMSCAELEKRICQVYGAQWGQS